MLGAWLWWRIRSSRVFWILLRAGQACVVLSVALGGVAQLTGRHAPGLTFRVECHDRNRLQHLAKYDGVDGQQEIPI